MIEFLKKIYNRIYINIYLIIQTKNKIIDNILEMSFIVSHKR